MQLTIEKLVYGGDGLARLPADEHGRGKAAFIPFVLSAEQVEAELVENKPGFARGHAQAILQASAARVTPRCPYFQKCGGCHYQHAGYEHQLEIKAAILKENLRRIAKLELVAELEVHPSPPWNYRNRSRLRVRPAPEFALGYYKFNSHELLPVEECPISSPLINRAITAVWQMGRARQIAEETREIEFFVNADDTQLLAEVYCASGVAQAKAEAFARVLQQSLPQAAGVVVFSGVADQGAGTRIASAGASELSYQVEQNAYRVSAGAFFQVNRHLTNELVKVVVAAHSGGNALDLYAGAGLFSVPLARSFAQVIAVESSQTSYSDLLYNSPSNLKSVCAPVEQYLGKAAGKLDLVIVDPPRAGLGASVVRSLVGLRPPAIAYVSCDPATLARDLAPLLSAGYRVQQAHLLDMFPQTYHLETVLQLAL